MNIPDLSHLRIKVFDLFGEYCTDQEDGETLFDEIVDTLEVADTIAIDFTGVSIGCSNFFSYSIARLYSVFSPDELNRRVRICGLKPHLADILRSCNASAKSKSIAP